MRNRNVICICCLLFCSCSTLLNNERQTVIIAADKNINDFRLSKGILIDSFNTSALNEKQYLIYRDKTPINIDFFKDRSKASYSLQSHHSIAYWLNIPLTDGIGMLIDRNAPQRFVYNRYNSFSLSDSGTVSKNNLFPQKDIAKHRSYYKAYRKKYLSDENFNFGKKGQIDLRLSYHFFNDVESKFNKINYDQGGILKGIGIGADFYTGKNQYISADVGTASSGSPCDACAVPDTVSHISYLSARYNYVLGKFDVGGGINISRITSICTDTVLPERKLHNISLGFSFAAAYKFSPSFGIELLFQPNIYTLTKKYSGFASQSYGSLNLNFIIPVKR